MFQQIGWAWISIQPWFESAEGPIDDSNSIWYASFQLDYLDYDAL